MCGNGLVYTWGYQPRVFVDRAIDRNDRYDRFRSEIIAIPEAMKPVIRQVVRQLLTLAGKYYESGDRGFPALDPRCRLAVTTARYVYAAIGGVLARRRFDPFIGRAYVTNIGKLWLVVKAWLASTRVRTLPTPTHVPKLELPLENSVFAIDAGFR